ncbi:unnamed protein product [Spirodela intermedia]|uniref:RanBP2-type domain-containing protein n=1 Tax=Spirodela intermedia TaxID=51605 RepID=A0A7I8LGI9_SPIIN|nr:unnamed protein product [Spirodela intermedia]
MAGAAPSSSPWPCSRCTFLNPPSRLFSCLVCLSPSSASAAAVSSSSPPRWSCRACTFDNLAGLHSCEVCGTTPALTSTILVDDGATLVEEPSSGPDANPPVGPSVGSVFQLRRCGDKRDLDAETCVSMDDHRSREKLARNEAGSIPVEDAELGSRSAPNTLKVLSYNVWFREDLELEERMNALGRLIQQHSPDIICLQEVTPNIYKIFQASSWWKSYECSVPREMAAMRVYFCMQMSKLPVKAFKCQPFGNSIMGRELCIADIDIGAGKILVVATSHLESPCPGPPKWDQMYSKERVAQAKDSVQMLGRARNAIFCGDMNWDEKLDGAFPAPAAAGWTDAWAELRPEENGWTYDTKSNPMLSGNRALQKRVDRFICNLPDFKIVGIDMIGLEPIPGLSYLKEKKVRKEMKTIVLPVLPSDHYGLLLTVQSM